MTAGDWPTVREIYLAGIATGNATFETSAPKCAGWDAAHLPDHRLVADDGGGVLGWAAVSPTSSRTVYAGVVEDSIYLAPEAHGSGLGRALLGALVESTERAGIWTVRTGIFPENAAGLALDRRAGFREVGIRDRPGQLNGVWRDVVLLERRSAVVGV